jgi:hypothetical protein
VPCWDDSAFGVAVTASGACSPSTTRSLPTIPARRSGLV